MSIILLVWFLGGGEQVFSAWCGNFREYGWLIRVSGRVAVEFDTWGKALIRGSANWLRRVSVAVAMDILPGNMRWFGLS